MPKFISQTNISLKKKKKRWTPKGRQSDQISLQEVKNIIDGKDIFDDQDSGTPQNLKPEEEGGPIEKKKPKADSEDGLIGGGMPDPAPA